MRDVLVFREQQARIEHREQLPFFQDLPVGWDSSVERYQVLKYMQDHIKYWSTAKAFTDVFTGEEIDANGTSYDDGVWHWTDEAIYYIRKYNLSVPREFVDHVLAQ